MSKKLDEWLKADYRNENMILSGLRYSLSRCTYQCSDGCDVFQSLLPVLSDRALEVALRDCEDEITLRTGTPKMEGMCDVQYIQKLMEAILKEEKHREEGSDDEERLIEKLEELQSKATYAEEYLSQAKHVLEYPDEPGIDEADFEERMDFAYRNVLALMVGVGEIRQKLKRKEIRYDEA